MASVSWEHRVRIPEDLNIGELDLQECDCEISYMYEGYQIQVCFGGNRTLFQCIKNLTERMVEND